MSGATTFSASAADEPVAKPTSVRWRIVALLMAFSFMSWFNRVSISVADEEIMGEFCISPTQMGALSSALLLAYMLCMTPGGLLIDRFGPRFALILMGFGSACFVGLTGIAGLPFMGLALALPSLFLIRALMGAFSAPMYPASGRMVSRWIALPRRAWANGIITGSALLGIAFSHVVFGLLIDEIGWRLAFAITGIMTAVLAAVWTDYSTNYPSQHVSVNVPEQVLIEGGSATSNDGEEKTEREANGRSQHRWWSLFRNRSLVLLTISYAAVGYFEYLVYFWMEYYFKEVLHFEVEESRWYAAVASLAMAVTMALGGWLSDRLVTRWGIRMGRAVVPAFGMVASAATLFIATNVEEKVWVVTWFVLAHGCIGLTEGSFWATAVELGGSKAGTSAGICNTGGNIGGMLAPTLTPWIGSYMKNWQWGMYLACVLCILGAVLWLWIDPTERCVDDVKRV